MIWPTQREAERATPPPAQETHNREKRVQPEQSAAEWRQSPPPHAKHPRRVHKSGEGVGWGWRVEYADVYLETVVGKKPGADVNNSRDSLHVRFSPSVVCPTIAFGNMRALTALAVNMKKCSNSIDFATCIYKKLPLTHNL